MKKTTVKLMIGAVLSTALLSGCGGSSSISSSTDTGEVVLPEVETSAGFKESMSQWQFYDTEDTPAYTILTGQITERVLNLSIMYDKEAYVAIAEGTKIDENNQIKRNIRFKRYYDNYNTSGMMAKHNALSGTIVFDLSGEEPSVSYDLVSEIDGVKVVKKSMSAWTGHLSEGLPVTLKELDFDPTSNGGTYIYNGDGKFTIIDDSSGCTLTAVARETSYRTMSKDNLYMSGNGFDFDFEILQDNTNCVVGEANAGTISMNFSERYTGISISAPLQNFHVTYGGQIKHE
jgi:hypothetical protein